jgi:hypothetical protein
MALSKPQAAQTPGDRSIRVGAAPRWELWLQRFALVVLRLGLAYLFFTQLWWKVPPTFGCTSERRLHRERRQAEHRLVRLPDLRG